MIIRVRVRETVGEAMLKSEKIDIAYSGMAIHGVDDGSEIAILDSVDVTRRLLIGTLRRAGLTILNDE